MAIIIANSKNVTGNYYVNFKIKKRFVYQFAMAIEKKANDYMYLKNKIC